MLCATAVECSTSRPVPYIRTRPLRFEAEDARFTVAARRLVGGNANAASRNASISSRGDRFHRLPVLEAQSPGLDPLDTFRHERMFASQPDAHAA